MNVENKNLKRTKVDIGRGITITSVPTSWPVSINMNAECKHYTRAKFFLLQIIELLLLNF